MASSREQAKRIHDRLAGVPPTNTQLNSMASLIDSGDAEAAADLAMDHPDFYNVTLKNWITPWSNLDETMFASLNDYTATVIGIIRDDLDFRTVLYGDIIYVASNTAGAPAYSMTNNNHYEYLEDQNISLMSDLVRQTQSSVTDLPAAATAGVMTTRQGAKAFFIDGTNRAQFR